MLCGIITVTWHKAFQCHCYVAEGGRSAGKFMVFCIRMNREIYTKGMSDETIRISIEQCFSLCVCVCVCVVFSHFSFLISLRNS